jgi:hypothetical protein
MQSIRVPAKSSCVGDLTSPGLSSQVPPGVPVRVSNVRSWPNAVIASTYVRLLSVKDPDARAFYESEGTRAGCTAFAICSRIHASDAATAPARAGTPGSKKAASAKHLAMFEVGCKGLAPPVTCAFEHALPSLAVENAHAFVGGGSSDGIQCMQPPKNHVPTEPCGLGLIIEWE